MAEQLVNSATSAVTGELLRMVFSGLTGKLDRQVAAVDKKLRRLDTLLVKIHSAVEAAEKRAVENTWLVQWRDRLKEASAEGDEVLASFRQRQRAVETAQATGDVQQQGHPSLSSASATTARNAPSSSGMVQGVRGAAKTLFSTDEDMERLNSAVERLEELSPEIGDFIKLLKLENPSPEPKTIPSETTDRVIVAAKRARPSDSTSNDNGRTLKILGIQLDAPLAPGKNQEASENRCSMVATMPMKQRRGLVDRLEEAFAAICRAVELADGRDLREHEWLACWASVLREAKGHGCAVLGAICAGNGDARAAAGGEAAGCDDQESRGLRRFVRCMESLASDVDHFTALA